MNTIAPTMTTIGAALSMPMGSLPPGNPGLRSAMLKRAIGLLEAVEREDVLADGLDLAHGVLLGPLARVRGQLERGVPQAHALEPVGGEILVAGARDLGRQLDAVHRGPRCRPRSRHVRQVVAAAAE